MKFMRKHLPIIIVLAVSIATHFAYFGYPRETVFDEVHFGKFVSGYYTHEYFFDIHPPLGKLIISAAGFTAGFKPGFSFAQIGEKFQDNTYLALRFLPSLAGTLLPVVIFLLLLELGISRIGATAGGLLVALESALLVQSRFILLDSFLLLFGFAALWLYMRYRHTGTVYNLLCAVALAGLSVSVKWTGLTFLAVIGIAEFIKLIRERSIGQLANVAVIAVIPFVLYFSIFALHFSLLGKSGPGDAFMTPQFRKTLVGSTDYADPTIKPEGLLMKFIELNEQMYLSNARLTATHPYSSKWYEWPFMTRPIYYWNEHVGSDSDARIYLIGNPAIWWIGTFAVFYALCSLKFWSNRKILLILGFYAFNILPFIGISRTMFMYHYFTALIIAIILTAYLIDQLPASDHFVTKKRVFGTLLGASLILFVFFSPLIYGLPMSARSYGLRTWFGSWR